MIATLPFMREEKKFLSKNYGKCGIIERALSKEIPQDLGKVHYLFHRPILYNDKRTTEIRAVFDASYTNSGPSLNDYIYDCLWYSFKIQIKLW